MATENETYPVRFNIDYPQKLNRFTTLVRIIWVIPILVILALLSGTGSGESWNETREEITSNGGGMIMGLSVATALMIVFRQRYPRWWFNFALELERFSARVGAYLFLLTDRYPSTVDKQSVHLDIEYPDVQKDLNRWLPLVKWLLAIPHYIALIFLAFAVVGTTIVAWFAILLTGRYPRGLFEFAVGVGRWANRVGAYAFLLTTDKYPPFSLD